MTITELGALGEFVGAIAVVATLIYLAFQVRQAQLMMKAQAAQARSDSALHLVIGRMSAPGFAEAAVAEDFDTLSPADKYRLFHHDFAMWRQLENLHYQVKIGVLDQRQAKLDQVAEAILSGPSDLWERMKEQDYVEADLRELMVRVYEQMNSQRETR